MRAGVTQVVKGLSAGRIIPQRFFVKLCSLLIVLLHKHRVALVDERCRVVAIGVHGEVRISIGLVVVLPLSEGKGQREQRPRLCDDDE